MGSYSYSYHLFTSDDPTIQYTAEFKPHLGLLEHNPNPYPPRKNLLFVQANRANHALRHKFHKPNVSAEKTKCFVDETSVIRNGTVL